MLDDEVLEIEGSTHELDNGAETGEIHKLGEEKQEKAIDDKAPSREHITNSAREGGNAFNRVEKVKISQYIYSEFKELSINDISHKLTSFDPKGEINFTEKELSPHVSRLLSHRLLLVVSSGHESKEEATRRIGEKISAKKNVEFRKLDNMSFKGKTPKIELANLQRLDKGENENVFLIVEVDNKKSNILAYNFYESAKNTKIELDSVIKELENKNIFIVCLLDKAVFEAEKPTSSSAFTNACWILDDNFIKQSLNQEKSEITEVDLEIIFEEQNLVHRMVMFIAVFFGHLDQRSFLDIVIFFLEHTDQKVILNEDSQLKDSNGIPQYDSLDKPVMVNVKKEISPLDYWSKHQGKILKTCRLISKDIGDKKRIITFSGQSVDVLKAFIRDYHFSFFEENMQLIDDCALLFDARMNTGGIIATTNLIIEVILENPDYYPNNWLFKYAKRLFDSMDSYFEEGEAIVWNYYYYYRFNYVMLRFLQEKDLHTIVIHFLDNLIIEKKYFYLLRFLVELSNSLERTGQNRFLWYQKIINAKHDDEKVIWKIYESFFKPENEQDWLETKESVLKWIPNENLIHEDYLPSHRIGLHFLVEMNVRELLLFPKSEFGQNIYAFHLFNETGENPQKIAVGNIVLILGIIDKYKFEGGILEDYGKILLFLSLDQYEELDGEKYGSHEEKLIPLVADLIECWFTVLFGWENYNPHERAEELSLKVINTVRENTTVAGFKKIRMRWRRKVRIYDDVVIDINLTPELSNKMGKTLKQIMKTRRKTIQRINQLIVNP